MQHGDRSCQLATSDTRTRVPSGVQVRIAAYELLAALRSLHQALIIAGGGMGLAPSQSPGVSSRCPPLPVPLRRGQ